MNEDNALQYVLAGFFALIFATPLLAFWRRKTWARALVIATLLLSIAACWRYYNIEQAENTQIAMLVITVLPPLAAAAVAGLIEVYWWRVRAARRARMMRHYPSHFRDGQRSQERTRRR